jgi:hypothetical protein
MVSAQNSFLHYASAYDPYAGMLCRLRIQELQQSSIRPDLLATAFARDLGYHHHDEGALLRTR